MINRPVISILVLLWLLPGAGTIHAAGKKPAGETVYVLHGFGRTKTAMWLLSARLKKAGYTVERIGYRSLWNTPEKIMAGVRQQMRETPPDSAVTVHFVGHSMGGLIIRAYLEEDMPGNLGNVVLIGTPNHGTELIDTYQDRWWMKMLGPMTLALGTGEEGFAHSLPDPEYPVGIIAGVSKIINNEHYLAGKDDGVVPVESARLPGADMLVINTGHSRLRYDKEVAEQTIEFLKNGRFSNKY